jgi:hypothetical protein
LRRFLEPLRREILSEMIGDPQTLLVDSTLLSVLHPRQVSQGAGFPAGAWVRWGSCSVYGVKLHLLCATNRVPICYELTPANVADVSLTEELLAEAALGYGAARRLLGDLAYRSEGLKEALAEVDILLVSEPSERRRGVRQQVEIALSSLKRVFGLGETLATTLGGLWQPGSRRRSRPTPTPWCSTGCWVVHKVASRSYGHEPNNRHLGHSDPAMTLRRYAHVLEDMREDAARAMDDLF